MGKHGKENLKISEIKDGWEFTRVLNTNRSLFCIHELGMENFLLHDEVKYGQKIVVFNNTIDADKYLKEYREIDIDTVDNRILTKEDTTHEREVYLVTKVRV